MIEIVVDGVEIQPHRFQMIYQKDPYPGGCTYSMTISDPEPVQSILERFGRAVVVPLSARDTSHLFNLLRMFLSLRYGLESPTYWANTVDELLVNDERVVVRGVCSPHSVT